MQQLEVSKSLYEEIKRDYNEAISIIQELKESTIGGDNHNELKLGAVNNWFWIMAFGDRRGFVSYLNDDNKKIEGYFDILEVNESFIKIKSGSSIILIPIHRLLKLKEGVSNGNWR